MVIPIALVLGLACTFYVYVAIRWYREVLVIRREDKAIVIRNGASVRSVRPAMVQRPAQAEAMDASIRYGSRDVIVMGRDEGCETSKASSRVGEIEMQDIIFVACTVGFFVVAIAYVWACDRLK